MDKCKYCKNEKDHKISKNECNEIYISEKYITTYCGWCGANTKVKIKYCPICGRNLEKGIKNETETKTQ